MSKHSNTKQRKAKLTSADMTLYVSARPESPGNDARLLLLCSGGGVEGRAERRDG